MVAQQNQHHDDNHRQEHKNQGVLNHALSFVVCQAPIQCLEMRSE